MPLLVLIIFALAFGVLIYFAARHYPTATGAAPPATEAAQEQLVKEVVRHDWVRRLLRSRLDPAAATGLALTAALLIVIVGGIAVGALAYLMRSNQRLVDIDASVGGWGADHATSWSTDAIQAVTELAGTPVTIAVIVIVVIADYIRAPNKWIPPFLITVVLGEIVLVNTIKQLLDRARPEFNPITETLGPSFPSGHSATAAALYAGVALVLARRRPPRVRAVLAGAAAGIAVAVACSRVMLGVHWLSDVIAGLAFGWAWFSLCAIAFGGRFLHFGAPAEKATRVAEQMEEPVASLDATP